MESDGFLYVFFDMGFGEALGFALWDVRIRAASIFMESTEKPTMCKSSNYLMSVGGIFFG